MKIIYFGSDLFSNCLSLLIRKRISIEVVFINDLQGNANFIKKISDDNNIKWRSDRPVKEILNQYISIDTTIFIVADYGYILPKTDVQYAVNIHPSLLPKGKGPTPLTYLIDNPEYAGVTIHKLTETPDDGDILVQEKFDIDHNETISSLMVKSQLLAESLLEKLLNDFNEIYDKAIPQVKALSSYQAIPSTERRFVTWSESTTRFRQALRQYGHFGILVELDKQLYITSEAEVTDFDHSFLPGRVIFEDFSIISIAISGGFVIFTKRSLMLINPTSNR